MSAVRFRELAHVPADLAALERFHAGLFSEQFPDPDERESLENMVMYLRRKAEGWYGPNDYHLVIAEQDDVAVGGFVLDYLALPNAGVIEFLFVAATVRGQGLGRALLAEAERLLAADALAKTGRPLDVIVAEMNDPFRRPDVPDNMDPFARARTWGAWGFGALDFPYVQPALSAGQGAVETLVLIAKPFRPDWQRALPGDVVTLAVAEYLRWAMRIDAPDASPEYRAMAGQLATRPSVPLVDLGRYVGHDPARPMHVTSLDGPEHPRFAPTMALFRATFGGSRAAIDERGFAEALARCGPTSAAGQPSDDGCRYHLWAVAASAEAPVEGLASFFTFGALGFCGYVALRGALAGTGRFSPLAARIEERMFEDSVTAGGWLAECEDATDIAPFLALGFRALDVRYVAPDLQQPSRAGQALRLLYKPFGRVYGNVPIDRDVLLSAIARVLDVVYGVAQAEAHPAFAQLRASIGGRATV